MLGSTQTTTTTKGGGEATLSIAPPPPVATLGFLADPVISGGATADAADGAADVTTSCAYGRRRFRSVTPGDLSGAPSVDLMRVGGASGCLDQKKNANASGQVRRVSPTSKKTKLLGRPRPCQLAAEEKETELERSAGVNARLVFFFFFFPAKFASAAAAGLCLRIRPQSGVAHSGTTHQSDGSRRLPLAAHIWALPASSGLWVEPFRESRTEPGS